MLGQLRPALRPHRVVAVVSVDVAKLIASNFAKLGGPVGVRPAVLIKVTPGTRTGGAVSGGTNPTTASFAATGLITDYSAFEQQNSLIKDGDRKVMLFGASIATGAIPDPNDRVTIDGATYTIVGPIKRDPAKATYILQCR